MELGLSIIVLASLTSSLTTARNEEFTVKRQEKGDSFAWSNAVGEECGRFSKGSAWPDSDNCQCNWGLTFSPEDTKCQSYRKQGKSHLKINKLIFRILIITQCSL